MTYQEFNPCPALRPYVERFWCVETAPADTYPTDHLITPNGGEGLVFACRPPTQSFVIDGNRLPLPEAYLFINPDRPWRVITEGPCAILGVFFKAGSLHSLLRTSMSEVVGQVVEPQAFLGSQSVRILLEQLADTPRPGARVALAEGFLIRLLGTAPCHPPLVRTAIHLMQQQQGRAGVEQIAAQMGVNRRTLEKQFAVKVGLTPKLYGRLVRFVAAQRYVARHPQARWLEVTYRFGYFDQSHLIKDFGRFTGAPPRAYALLDKFLVEHFIQVAEHCDSF